MELLSLSEFRTVDYTPNMIDGARLCPKCLMQCNPNPVGIGLK